MKGPELPGWIRRPLRPARRAVRTLADVAWRLRIRRDPVFVLGCHKAGTTAIGALLAEATGERFSNDVFYFAGKEPGVSVAEYARRHPRHFAAGINKDPNFTFMAPELRDAFPGARFIFIVRDPRQNIRSILNRLRLPGDQPALTDPDLGRVLASRWRWLFEDAVEDGVCPDYVGVVARHWLRAARAYGPSRDFVRLVRYEDFVADKEGTIRDLAREVGLAPVRDISDRVDRQYQKKGKSGVEPGEFYGPGNLARIEALCADAMVEFGYR